MAKAHTSGSGWHKESLRHRNARKHGRAGGNYASKAVQSRVGITIAQRDAFFKSKDLRKDMTYNQLKRAGVKLTPTGDADKDGKPNALDCRPLNKKKQDDMPVQEIDTFLDNAQKTQKEKEMTKTDRFKQIVKEDAVKIGEALKSAEQKAEAKIKEKYEAYKKKKEVEKDWAKVKKVRELNTALKEKIYSEDEIDVRTLSENELEKLAIVEGEGLFGNKYENELKRRIKAETDLKADLTIAKLESKKREKERLQEYSKTAEKKKESGGGEDFFTWITSPNK